MIINCWIALSAAAKQAVNERLNWDTETQGEYTGPVTDTEYQIFRRMAHHSVVQNMFRTGTFGSKDWSLYSLYFDLTREGANKLQDALDYLEANRSNNFQIIGAWHWDGRQVGTQWTDETQTATTGTPTYPIPTTQLLKLMPTIKTYDENGNLVSETEPTELTDVNLVQGQSPRRFT